MPRIVHPDDFLSQQRLLFDIKIKHEGDGNSPLTLYLPQQGIKFATLTANAALAATHETSRALLSRQAENWRELRNNVSAIPFSTLKAMVQYLKSFYRGNVLALGDWGITINQKKVVYPVKFIDMVSLFKTFKQRHDDLDADSPLTTYLNEHGVDLTTLSAKLETAGTYHENLQEAEKNAENETQLRNILWQPVMRVILGIGTYLVKLYNNNEKKLGLWGFTVNDSPRKPKLRTSKIKPADKKYLKGVTIGGALTNTGLTELHVYKGSNTAGTPVIVHSGEKIGMTKGFSAITVVNPSTLLSGLLTVLMSI
ncbi:MAG: hypothetical protein ABJB05_04780 [Parafilimonas sp.]